MVTDEWFRIADRLLFIHNPSWNNENLEFCEMAISKSMRHGKLQQKHFSRRSHSAKESSMTITGYRDSWNNEDHYAFRGEKYPTPTTHQNSRRTFRNEFHDIYIHSLDYFAWFSSTLELNSDIFLKVDFFLQSNKETVSTNLEGSVARNYRSVDRWLDKFM